MSLKSRLKNNALARGLYDRLMYEALFDPDELIYATPRFDRSDAPRLNLVLLGLAKEAVFGGVSTALDVHRRLAAELGCDERIVVTGQERFDGESTFVPEGYRNDPYSSKALVFLAEDSELEVRASDIFIFTYWSTRYSLQSVIESREEYFGLRCRDIYLIQDFEPAFFPWSTEYALADSTYAYRRDDTVAVFNSHQLKDFFLKQGYEFSEAFCFEPVMNGRLREHLFELGKAPRKREKLIIFYGRPSQKRNAFTVVRSALKLWSGRYARSSEWRVVSLGESYPSFKLADGRAVEVAGKVSLDEYAGYLSTAFAGVSLMLSPHPSYPPLEMSAYGIKTITNDFECKNLAEWSEAVRSVSICTPDAVADALAAACDEYYACDGRIEPKPYLGYLQEDCISSILGEIMQALDAKSGAK